MARDCSKGESNRVALLLEVQLLCGRDHLGKVSVGFGVRVLLGRRGDPLVGDREVHSDVDLALGEVEVESGQEFFDQIGWTEAPQ